MQHFHSEPEPHSVYADANASPLNTGAPTNTFDATEQRRLQETIEDYLDRVCRPLMDTLPYAARQELRLEIAQHLNSLVQAYRESGYSPALATEKALDKFGPPHLVAQKWNPVAVRAGKYQRIERWFTGQWQGIAATLTLCGVAGLLGFMLHHNNTLSLHALVSNPQSAVSSAAVPSPRPVAVASITTEQMMLAELAAQQAALNQARADFMSAQAQLTAQQMALRSAEMSVMHVWPTEPAIQDILQLKRQVLEQQIVLEHQRMLERQAAIAQAEATREALRAQAEEATREALRASRASLGY